jgi:hypothetical protein
VIDELFVAAGNGRVDDVDAIHSGVAPLFQLIGDGLWRPPRRENCARCT